MTSTITTFEAATRGVYSRNQSSTAHTAAESRDSLENPTTSIADPANWLTDALGSSESASGVRVTPKSALGYSPWWRGVNLLSAGVGKLPLLIYRRVGAGKEKDPSHQAYRLLRYRANNELMSATLFKQILTAWAINTGNGYAWIPRAGDARPLELIILDPQNVMPFRENGRLWYGVRVDGLWRRVSPMDIFHLKGLSADGLVGYSTYQMAKESIGEGVAAQKYGSVFFRNAARPSVVIEIPGGMSDEAQRTFLQQWERMHTGLDSAHRTAILTNGGKINPFSSNAQESQLHEMRKFNLVDIANWIGVPVHKVGGEGRTAYASLEQENQSYLDDSLDYWLVKWEDESREKLFTEAQKDGDTHVVEFLRAALVRADIVTRYTAHNIALRGGFANRDEVRGSENMTPLPNGEGQKFFAPLELQVIGDNKPPEVDDLPSLLTITNAVVAGTLPPDAAKAMLTVSFPLLTSQQINQIVDPLDGWEVPSPEPVTPAIPPQDQLPEQDATQDDQQQNPPPGQDPPSDSPAAIARTLVLDATRRACNHLQVHTLKRAKKSDNFLNEMDDCRTADETRVSEIINSAVKMLGSIADSTQTTDTVTRFVVDRVKSEMLSAADSAHSRDELVAAVELRMESILKTLPDAVADLITNQGRG